MKVREMELLVRVAEAGSMSLAAQQLNLTPAAVSAAVRRVEDSLGVRIFERTTRSLHPTDDGLVVLEGCEAVLARWQSTLDAVQGARAELQGTVHVSAPSDTSYTVLRPVVVDLCARHPELRVVLDVSDVVQHLHRAAIDLAIRYGPLEDSSLTARKLAEGPTVLVAAPAYLAKHTAPERPRDLVHHRCLTLRLGGTPSTEWALWCGGQVQRVPVVRALVGDGYLVRRWALDGHGIALKSLIDVISDLEAGRLVRVLPGCEGRRTVVHAVFPSRRFLPARVRALDVAIAERFEALQARCDAWLATTAG